MNERSKVIDYIGSNTEILNYKSRQTFITAPQARILTLSNRNCIVYRVIIELFEAHCSALYLLKLCVGAL